jgi:vacuolar-type H+-ATPase catalytic subunit A/Vma1
MKVDLIVAGELVGLVRDAAVISRVGMSRVIEGYRDRNIVVITQEGMSRIHDLVMQLEMMEEDIRRYMVDMGLNTMEGVLFISYFMDL